MRVGRVRDDQGLGRASATEVRSRLAIKPDSVLAFPAGRTPVWMYRELVAMGQRGDPALDFSQAAILDVDEFCGVSRDHPGSCGTYLWRHLLSHVTLPPHRVRLLDGAAQDPDAECRRHEAQIGEWGGLDLVVLGIGENGHVALNEPGSSFDSRARPVTLTFSTRAANVYLFGSLDQTPVQGLTLGLATLMAAREVLLLASGAHKACIVAQALGGPVTRDVPASLLQRHTNLTVIVDEAAGAEL